MDLVALDPGGTTGWSWLNEDGIEWGELGEGRAHHYKLEQFLYNASGTAKRRNSRLVVLYEPFDNRAAVEAEIISGEYVGVVRLFNQKTGTPIIPRGVANMKTWCRIDDIDYEKLRATELYVPGMPHATDANGHILHYIVHEQAHLEFTKRCLQKLRRYIVGNG